MAAVSGTLRNVVIDQGPYDQVGVDLRVVKVYFDSNGQNVTSGSDTLDIASLGAGIAGFARDGKTYTPVAASLVQAYRSGSTNVFGTVAISSGTLVLTPKAANFSSNAGVTGASVVDAQFGVSVTCTVA